MKLTKPKPLTLTQTTKTLSATFFSEQLPQGEDAVFNAIKNTSPTDLIVIAIKHQGNNGKKDHYHLIAKDPDNNGSFVVGYSDAAEPPVRCGVSHLSGQT